MLFGIICYPADNLGQLPCCGKQFAPYLGVISARIELVPQRAERSR